VLVEHLFDLRQRKHGLTLTVPADAGEPRCHATSGLPSVKWTDPLGRFRHASARFPAVYSLVCAATGYARSLSSIIV
jgi:hypothetical protein